MKNILLIFLTFFSFTAVFAQDEDALSFSELDKSPLDVVMYRDANQTAVARVIYSRPSKRDREIFGKLVPYDELWRTGANEATEIAFYRDVIINDQLIKAGSYSIYTIPGRDQWSFILNTATTQSGTEHDPKKDILTCPMETIPSPQEIESFSISFLEQNNGAILFLGWDETIASLEFKIAGS
ncbi:Protein of unknown function (DUF2911) [Nonlabens dokdonensis]|uniref:Secreted protein n=2 Tax=Nonlabens dokdonensis TaxID=328515 RepID=L7W6X9_NONDD|nr:DUF2911 domain-containing protein [Nonlabens dokdonensis]AGC75551.1 secreted protein [Nonlabens dokdonensis DSW-6]PZX43245.1 Protein of unknown function (DUF2911) [Nonlabens dokdonensis]